MAGKDEGFGGGFPPPAYRLDFGIFSSASRSHRSICFRGVRSARLATFFGGGRKGQIIFLLLFGPALR